MNKERRKSEKERRELAQTHAGEIVEGSGIIGTPRKMDTMMSLRIPSDLMGTLDDACKLRDMTLTEYMLHAAERLAREETAICSVNTTTIA